MYKSIPTDSYIHDEPVAELIKLSSRGLIGSDRLRLIKRAGERFVHDFEKVAVQPGEVPVHWLAMSATEAAGPNRNGDGFRENPLRKQHATFVKHARAYRNHKNRDESKSYGRIIKSAYNDKMRRVELVIGYNGTKEAAERNGGLVADEELEALDKGKDLAGSMASQVPYDVCFRAGALVETRDGLSPIEGIRPGTLVRTHTGEFRPVLESMRRSYAGQMVSIEIMGIPEALDVTEGHPLYVVPRASVQDCNGQLRVSNRKKRVGSLAVARRRHTFRDGSSVCARCEVSTGLAATWVPAGEVRVGDYALYPVQEPGVVEVAPAYAYLVGLYAGDGCPIRQRRGRKKIGDYALQGITMTLDDAQPAVIELAKRHAKDVHGRIQPVYDAGDGKKAKILAVYSGELAAFALEYVGEGSRTKRLRPEVFSWNREARLHLLGGLIDSDGSVDFNKRYGAGRHLTTNRQLASDIQRLWWGLGVQASVHSEWCDSSYGGRVLIHVVSIGRSAVQLLVRYSAKASGVTPARYAIGRAFVRGGYMHVPIMRIRKRYNELDVYNLSVEEDESYVVGVAVHNCSSCGHKARTREEYCTEDMCKRGGLKENIGTTCADGHQLHADNPINRFIDFSKVARGADRTAYAFGLLEKAASAARVISGAELAELVGMEDDYDPYDLRSALKRDRQAVLEKLAWLEQTLVPDGMDLAVPPDDVSATLPRCDAGEIFRALADVKVAMPLPLFLTQLAGAPPDVAAEAAADVARYLPGVFSRMLKDADWREPAADRYTPARAAGPAARAFAAKLAADCGLARWRCAERIKAAAFGNAPAGRWVGPIFDVIPSPGEKLAREYARHQLEILRANQRDEDFDFLSTLLVRANHRTLA